MAGSEQDVLGPLVVTDGTIRREATIRRKAYEEKTVASSEVNDHIEEGYEFVRKLKNKRTKLRKPKPHDVQFENETWLLMYLLGYSELNKGRTFKINYGKQTEGTVLSKQIDVFAKDEETVIVGECKSSLKQSSRKLQKDINEFDGLKGQISRAIKKHYGPNFKPKILWIIFTRNISWSAPDLQRAKEANIHVVRDTDLRYYMQIADHLRSAARFQFLAEFLRDQKIPELSDKSVFAIRRKIGGRTSYTFSISADHLLKISFVNHRSLNDPDGAPSYQRLVSRTRLKQVSSFINDGGYFPTNLLVNFKKKVRFDKKDVKDDGETVYGDLYLPDRYRSIWIIDGQHRLYGYSSAKPERLNDSLLVVAFENLDPTEEANLFVTINHEQKSVPKTLLDDLEGELKWGSTVPSERIGAISARLIGVLNAEITGPIGSRVTRQGIKATDVVCLTVPALKDALQRSGLVGEVKLKKEYAPGPLCGTSDEETLIRAREVLNRYFDAIRTSNLRQWDAGRKGHLCTNRAVAGQIYLLAALIDYLSGNTSLDPRELSSDELTSELDDYFDPIVKWFSEATDTQISSRFTVPNGSGAAREYYFRLCQIVQQQHGDFDPDGLRNWTEERSEERVEGASHRLEQIELFVQQVVFDTLKIKYGESSDEYWGTGIRDTKLKTAAYGRQQEADPSDRLPLENYLMFIDYKTIVEQKECWPDYKEIFSIPMPGEPPKNKDLGWMVRINELRRVKAHPSKDKNYKVEDFEFIDYIYAELTGDE